MKTRKIAGYLSMSRIVLGVILCASLWCSPGFSTTTVPVQGDLSAKTSEELTALAWAAANKADFQELERIVKTALGRYEQEALQQGAALSAFPARDAMDKYRAMNNVATILFVRAEGLRDQGKSDQSIAAFQDLVKIYPYAQCWDPSRGGYWSVAEKSGIIINQLKGINTQEDKPDTRPMTVPQLLTPGTDPVVDYSKYGTFSGVGTKDYKFQINNPNLLAKAVGEGIYPNTADVLKNPRYKEAYKAGRLEGTYWDFVNTPDLEAAYLKWAVAPEDPGVKLFYLGTIFESAGMYLRAIKAYYALIVHFPRTLAQTYWNTPWYPAQAAIAKIKNLLREHPELGYVYKGAKVDVVNGLDNDTSNDIFLVSPGALHKGVYRITKVPLGQPVRTLGGKKTKLVQYKNGHWQMFVDGKPFMIKGVTYAPTKVGQSPDKNTVENWMTQDSTGSGWPDSPYKSWVDKNRNNIQDPDEPVAGDFQLMKEMGVNTIRFYHHPDLPVKKVLHDMYERYGIRCIMGDFLGKYAIGSGATWAEGTDYENPKHLASMMKAVEDMVLEYKDEPYILFWILGNENNYGVASNGDKKPKAYYTFVNKVAKRIKELDPDRPVAICNGETTYAEMIAQYAPEIDIFGANVYRGNYGFGSFWGDVRRTLDRPAFPTEYGAPAYVRGRPLEHGEDAQAAYHRAAWNDILENAAGSEDGEGNAIGGIAFEWLDEWWKNYDPSVHDTKADARGPFEGGYYFEEWFGLMGQGDGKHSPFMRQPRKAYYMYKNLWSK
ncbi:MAG: hypothetical protein HQL18_02545 [Candidatus Omnitrophica bacterium]|nr:hypothetical protein [Candidatus Omnitrophota bacterium]